jgi:hypothetical protein
MVYDSTAYIMCLVSKAMSYLGSSLVKQTYFKWLLYEIFFLIQLNCEMVVYLRVLSLDLYISFFILKPQSFELKLFGLYLASVFFGECKARYWLVALHPFLPDPVCSYLLLFINFAIANHLFCTFSV